MNADAKSFLVDLRHRVERMETLSVRYAKYANAWERVKSIIKTRGMARSDLFRRGVELPECFLKYWKP